MDMARGRDRCVQNVLELSIVSNVQKQNGKVIVVLLDLLGL